MFYYRYQLFFCTNLRQNGKRCCATAQAEALREYAKKSLKKLGLHEVGQCRASSCSCLGRCDEGPVLVIYPEGVWYSYKTSQDVDEIIEQHIQNGKHVTRLFLPNHPPREAEFAN